MINYLGQLVFIKRIHRNQFRRILRGSQRMKKSDDPFIINRINEQLTITNLEINTSHVSKYIFGEDTLNIEIVARQYLLARRAGPRLNKSIMSYFGSRKLRFIVPLPEVWLSLLENNNISIDRFKSKILFKIIVFKYFIYGIFAVFFSLINIFRLNRSKKISSTGKFVSFINLAPHSLPRLSSNESYDIINWYLNWEGSVKNLSEIHHNVKAPNRFHRSILLRNSQYIPSLCGLKNYLNFIIWGLSSIVISFVSFFCGRWVNCMLLQEAALAKRVSLAKNRFLASEYLFPISSSNFRPLWTYAAERRGSIITRYNYAASFQQFLTNHGYPYKEIGYQSMNWPRILQWAVPYAEYTQSVLLDKKVKVEVVPPIYYRDFDIDIPSSNKPMISIFDVTPVRASFSSILIHEMEYHTYLIGKQFLEDIYDVVVSSGYNIMLKRKRSYGNIHDRTYIKFLNSFSSRPGVICSHPEVSAFRVIKNSYAAISTPFTSTALIAKHFSKPSIYYDSAKMLFKDDRGAQGIPLISGKFELSEWIQNLKK